MYFPNSRKSCQRICTWIDYWRNKKWRALLYCPNSKIDGEKVEWSKFIDINEYDGDLVRDIGLIVFSTAMAILYPQKDKEIISVLLWRELSLRIQIGTGP